MSVLGRGRCKVQTLHGTALQRYSVASALTRSWEHYIKAPKVTPGWEPVSIRFGITDLETDFQ